MSYLEGTIKQFRYYEMLGTKTLSRLSEDQLFVHPAELCNNMAMLVKHISGNMLSRWTDFLTSDGEKSWRERDQEFANDLKSKEEVIEAWKKGWECFYEAVLPLQESDIERIVYIRNQGHTVQEAIGRQLAHYSYHIGQMVFLGKMLLGNQWESLSIPLGESSGFNQQKFSKSKERGHFTDEFIDNNKKE